MNHRLFIGSSLLELFFSIHQQPAIRKDTEMPAAEDMQSMRPVFKDGDVWFIICAKQEQLPERRDLTEGDPLAQDPDVAGRVREEALSRGELPEVSLQSVEGYTLWRKFRYTVEERREGSDTFYDVVVTYVGHHGVPEAVLVEHGLRVITAPVPKLRYVFGRAGALSEIEWYDRKQNVPVNDGPIALDWDFIELPAGFPSFQVAVFDGKDRSSVNACSQYARIGDKVATVWLSENLSDIHPVASYPGVRYEVQRWRKPGKWWSEAFVVKYRTVLLLARMLE